MAANSDYLTAIHKAPCDVNNIYAKINKEAMFNAMKDLNGSEFFLWAFCASQSQRLYNFEFGPAGIESEIGLPKSTFKTAKKGLIDKGYLIKSGNKIQFYEISQKSKNQIVADQSNFQLVEEQDKIQTVEQESKNYPEARKVKNQTFSYVGADGEEFIF